MNKDNDVKKLCMGCMSKVEDKEIPCPHCGWRDDQQELTAHQLPPQTILNGKYLLGRVLGEGGFGITYLGWDLNLDMKVAIKEYYPAGFVTREITAATTVTPFSGEKREAYISGLDKFVGEAKSLAKFYSLPGIVSVKDFFKENGTAYIVMEYIEGVTLKQYLQKEGGKLPVYQVLEWVKPLIVSLSQMHAAGIIHRDISPDNVMITRNGDIKLLDFGAARDISVEGAKSLSVLLKPGYAPEEQYRTRGNQGPWTDVYALCATIYKAITGQTPPESMERMHEDSLVPPSKLGISLTGDQEAALIKGMAVLQKNRYQNMSELYEGLNPFFVDQKASTQVGPVTPLREEERSPTQSDHIQPSPASELSISSAVAPVANATPIQSKKSRKVLIIGAISLALTIFTLFIVLKIIDNRNRDALSSKDDISYNDVSSGVSSNEGSETTKEPEPTTTADPSKDALAETVYGNTSGNLANNGMAAFSNGWIYYANYDDDEKLYKSGSEGRDFVKLSDDKVSYINVVDEWVYYVSGENSNIYKIRTDGTERSLVCDDEISQMTVVGDWIYYSNMSDEFFLYKIKTDGTEKTRLISDFSSGINVVGDVIYYSDYNVHNICKIGTDGSNKTIINASDACFMINVEKDWIYYRNNNDNGKLYKIKTDGSERTCLNQDNSSSVNVVGEWIYYRNNSDKSSLYRIRTDGSGQTKLNDVGTNAICVAADKIYYCNTETGKGEVYDPEAIKDEVYEPKYGAGDPEAGKESGTEAEGIYSTVFDSVIARVGRDDVKEIQSGQLVKAENNIDFIVQGSKILGTSDDGEFSFAQVKLQLSISENYSEALYMDDYNFAILAVENPGECYYAVGHSDIDVKSVEGFPLILNDTDPVEVLLYFQIPAEYKDLLFINTNFFNGEEAGPVYVLGKGN